MNFCLSYSSLEFLSLPGSPIYSLLRNYWSFSYLLNQFEGAFGKWCERKMSTYSVIKYSTTYWHWTFNFWLVYFIQGKRLLTFSSRCITTSLQHYSLGPCLRKLILHHLWSHQQPSLKIPTHCPPIFASGLVSKQRLSRFLKTRWKVCFTNSFTAPL